MTRFLWLIATFVLAGTPASAFCGFFVAKADGELFNQSSRVAYVRDGRRSTITMGADYRGPVSEFAMVIPTPKVLGADDIRTVNESILEHLDEYTAPRLVEYHDYNPCPSTLPAPALEPVVVVEDTTAPTPRSLGVQIHGQYEIDAYDVLILGARQSDGLTTFLTQEGYTLPDGAEAVLGEYIDMGMKFFVAKVNLDRHAAGESQELKPLQISFRSRDFMLPIQLGKLNAEDSQDALFFFLTRKGRVELANYPARAIPADVRIPTFVEDMFGDFYTKVFSRVVGAQGGIVLEYAWDMSWCDPCASAPLSNADLATLGVSWLREGSGQGQDVYVTRYHAQYTRDQLRADPMFRVTQNRENFQGRYIMTQPFVGDVSCEAGQEYVEEVRSRLRREAVDLAEITGWTARGIEHRIRQSVPDDYW